MSGGPDDPFKTVGVGGGGETLRIEDFMAQIKKQGLLEPKTRTRRRSGLELEPWRSRLRHLCQLIARDRQGFCPINGVLLTLPVTAADTPGEVEDIISACRNDLSTAFDTYRLRCPILVMVSGVEKLPGFSDLVERLPQGQSGKRMGQRFPLIPDLKPSEVPARIESSVEWIASNLFPSMVHSLLQVETPGGEGVEDVMRTNANLYRFMMEVRDRRNRLASLVRDCIPTDSDEPLLFGGCYFAGTGEDTATGQAFSPGVLKRLIEEQDNVTWTAHALEQDASSQRLSRLIKTCLIVYITLGTLTSLGLVAWKVLFSSDES
jgi:type VI protein secretion system component VasK